jgi:hypothetical protein
MKTLKSRALRFLDSIDHLANSLRPMNLLPPEMILRIATYLIDETEYYHPLLVATHINRYWRETILGSASLWTSIDSRHPKLAIVCMERSNRAGLSVTLRPNIPLDFISELQSHATRIKALDVSMPPSNFQRILQRLDPHSIRLESLTLDFSSVKPLPCVSFPRLLSFDMSRLKVLNVQNVSFVSPFFRPTNLSKLSIVSSSGCLSALLDLIAANIRLEEILIVSRVSDLQYPSVDVIPLPHLRVLNVTLPWHAIKTLLHRVSLPPSAKLIVTTAMQEHEKKEFIPALLPQRLDPLQNLLKIETLTYHYSQVANHQTLCGSSSSNTSQTHRTSPFRTGSFTFRWTAFTRFDLVFSPLSLTHVRHLQLNLDCVYSFRNAQVGRVDGIARKFVSVDSRDLYCEWRGVFKSLDQLERLTVVRLRNLVELVGILTDSDPVPRLDAYQHRGRDSICRNSGVSSVRTTLLPPHREGFPKDSLCPSLHTLEFIECHWLCSQFPVLLDFVKRRLASPQDPLVLSPASCLPSTLNPPAVVSPIRRIHIQSFRPSLLPCSQDIEALKELVDTIVTDAEPHKSRSSRGVESHAGGYERKPPLCTVCGTDLGLS